MHLSKVTGSNVVPEPASVRRPKPVVLLILDGWGHRDDPRDNALALAAIPNWRRLVAEHPSVLVHTEGVHVGLPEGQMGNSEVGHMNIGAGRVVYQDLTRIDAAIADGGFFANDALRAACAAANASGGTLHLMGLLSPGGVHSHEAHLFAMLELARREGVARVAVHAFTDGRDMPPRSAAPSLRALEAACAAAGNARVASVSGRYYAMDRDRRWERVRRAWDAIVEAQSPHRAPSAIAALEAAYARNENDEFVAPTIIEGTTPMRDGDAVVFMNFRADRARQLSAAFVAPGFDGFEARRPALSRFTCLTEYDAMLPAPLAFPPDDLRNTFGEVLGANGLSQLRIAETEKYAHVTFFFNGGRETPFPGEERILVPSPQVATYDLQPEMSCPEVTEKLVAAIGSGRFDVVVCNYANPDMVGHSGDLQAAIKAVEAVDRALGEVVAAVLAQGGELLVTADHGNVEMMRDPETGEPHTSHTVGPVDLVYVGGRHEARLREGGALRDLAPTMLDLLGVPKPAEMTGRSLLA
ncbi:2,3-bisphosphoglycerate-independent phosphoglycerate mutase [Luteimonas granuli]|uniref:2,3-bisphosphoglycerate-independent phosphoglycerate mutase n=1 Tax=Luteimonas granuli TaxID=1176533 RepID=A0A518N3S9_9GAMM|nr:2,3-bisphosphoglycerate-independent phosphoglycerate mutase [Luteimonas granuli]QDW66591.1 2,3-bisphosphoglycerate-independent phosphoglycerate mutase [Luteimonas granuli]